MMRILGCFIITLVALTFSTLSACETAGNGGSSSATTTNHIDVLRSGQMAIGGETTGWVLKRKDQPDLEVDVSRISTEAETLDGLCVKIRGRIQQKNYVERGPTPVLLAERIELVD